MVETQNELKEKIRSNRRLTQKLDKITEKQSKLEDELQKMTEQNAAYLQKLQKPVMENEAAENDLLNQKSRIDQFKTYNWRLDIRAKKSVDKLQKKHAQLEICETEKITVLNYFETRLNELESFIKLLTSKECQCQSDLKDEKRRNNDYRTTGGRCLPVIIKAIYNWTAVDDDELSFEMGDEIIKLSEPDSEGMIELKVRHITVIISRMGRRNASANGCNRSLPNRIRGSIMTLIEKLEEMPKLGQQITVILLFLQSAIRIWMT